MITMKPWNKKKAKKTLMAAVVGLVPFGTPLAQADTAVTTSATGTSSAASAAEAAKAGVAWLGKNAMATMHDWSVVATFAGTNRFTASIWTANELGQLKTTSDYARFILALLAAGLDPHDYQGKNYVALLAQTQLKGGTDAGKFADNLDGSGTDLINVQAWSIIALQDAGKASYNWMAARNWLVSQQNPDGGFGYSKSYKNSDPDDTAAAILALTLLGMKKDNQVIAKALQYLASTQNADGGFGGGGSSNSDSTGVVIDALTAVGDDASSWTKGAANPVGALLGFWDEASGGFKYDNSGSSWSGVNAYSTRDGVIGLGAVMYHQSVYQRLHWQRLDKLNPYWQSVSANGGTFILHVWHPWRELMPLAVAGSYLNQLNPYWQSVVKAHGMYVSHVWTPWNANLATKALIGSFGLNTVHLNLIGS